MDCLDVPGGGSESTLTAPPGILPKAMSGVGWGADVDGGGGAVEEFPIPGDEGEGEALGEGNVDGVGAAEADGGGEVGGVVGKRGIRVMESHVP